MADVGRIQIREIHVPARWSKGGASTPDEMEFYLFSVRSVKDSVCFYDLSDSHCGRMALCPKSTVESQRYFIMSVVVSHSAMDSHKTSNYVDIPAAIGCSFERY